MLKVKIICCAVLAACLAVTAAPYQTFKMDQKNYVPFDNTTTVTVECPDPAAVKWLESHFAEWYGAYAPKVVAAGGARDRATADAQERVPSGDEAYAAETGADGAKIAARTLAGVRWAAYTLRRPRDGSFPRSPFRTVRISRSAPCTSAGFRRCARSRSSARSASRRS